jgi:thioester reductase-like protein
MTRVLVAGATGYLGRFVARAFNRKPSAPCATGAGTPTWRRG